MSFLTDEKLHKLVHLYSKFSNLWDKEHHCYENLRSRYESYSKILGSLSMPIYVSVSDVICKLKELRNNYVCELQKIEIASRAGCTYRPDHTWFGIMNEFLYDHLDADEKLAELSSSEDGAASSEEILEMCHAKNCCSDSNSASDSDSDGSLDPRNELSLKRTRGRFKPPKKSQAYFLRSPTVLRSTKMNTKYEFPRKIRAPSIPAENVGFQKRTNDVASRALDMEQCIQLDVKMTSSDVSIKYLRTESVNGDEKRYKKNLKGPRCSIDKPPCFNNIKMMISRSGYTASNLERKSSEVKDKDAEFWEMMSMLDVGVSCPLTKLEATYSPDSSCSSITNIKSNATCCRPKCEDINDRNRVEKIIEAVDAAKRKCGTSKERQSCCSKLERIKECKDFQKRDETLRLEPCPKKMKVMCLGDGTLFDDNLLELLQDLSIKICPFDGGCASGNCSATDDPDDVFDNFLSCETCSLATRPVKEYEMDAAGSAASNDTESGPSNHEKVSITAENVSKIETNSEIIEAAAPGERPVDISESTMEPEVDSRGPGLENDDDKKSKDTDSARSNIEEKKKDGSLIPEAERNYDVRVLLESADSGSSSAKDAIFHEAKKELSEAGRLYNGGKYITGSRIEESVEFDYFGAQVALSLKMMGKQRAMKLKKIIAETLQSEEIKKFS